MKIITYPDPRLLQRSEECKQEDLPEILKLKPELLKTMLAAKGLGLAAVQVGILKRYCLMLDMSTALGKEAPQAHVIINPEILEIDPEIQDGDEGCLSIPYTLEKTKRPIQVLVKFRDETWTERTAVFYGIQARCICHEIDHMDGKLFISTMKLQMWLKKMRKKGVM